MVDRNWEVWRGLSPANAADYDGSMVANVSPQWNIPFGDVINESGLFAPQTTKYPGTNLLPIDDHCAACYRRIWTIIDWIGVDLLAEFDPIIFNITSVEEALVRNLAPETLQTRRPDDSNVRALMEANDAPEETLVKIAQEDCGSMKLPPKIKIFAHRYNVDIQYMQQEMCDLVLKRVVQSKIEVETPNRPVRDTEQECSIMPSQSPSGATIMPLFLEPKDLLPLFPCDEKDRVVGGVPM